MRFQPRRVATVAGKSPLTASMELAPLSGDSATPFGAGGPQISVEQNSRITGEVLPGPKVFIDVYGKVTILMFDGSV